MALTLGDNFSYGGSKPLDARLSYSTLADMKAVADATMYNGCLAYCVATDKTYQWKSTNTVDADTGRWREFSSGGSSEDPNAYHTGDTAFTDIDDGDYIPVYDTSATAKKKSLWSNIKSVLKAYFDTLYKLTAGTNIAISSDNVISTTSTYTTRYSTEEQVVGTWIDGKPIYQKVIVTPVTNLTVGYQIWIRIVNRSDIDLDRLIDIKSKIVFDNHSNDEYIIPYYATQSFEGVTDTNPARAAVATSNSGISILIKQNFYNATLSGNITSIIQYTKTTDV